MKTNKTQIVNALTVAKNYMEADLDHYKDEGAKEAVKEIKRSLKIVSEALIEAEKNTQPKKVLITVEGGIIQSIGSNDKNIQFVTVDYDDQGDEPVLIKGPEKAHYTSNFFYKGLKDAADPASKEVYKFLKSIKY